jgi:hypothetical protein
MISQSVGTWYVIVTLIGLVVGIAVICYSYGPKRKRSIPPAEWVQRYNARIREKGGYDGEEGYFEMTGMKFEDGCVAGFENDPEGAADEEMSYWDADE